MNLEEQRFGRWLVIELSEPKIEKNGCASQRWKCRCDCGTERIVLQASLLSGKSKSCGCLNREIASSINKTHGLSKENRKLYSIWNGMKNRCFYEKSPDYKNYGGRGIIMCDEWLGENGFENFYNWSMEHGYEEGLSIERKDVNGNYCPKNCCFIPLKDQSKNKRNSLTDTERFKICPICGKRYEVNQRKVGKTCSQSCGIKLREMNRPKKEIEMSSCIVCGKEFRKRIDHGKPRIYCSTACMGIGKTQILEYDGEKLSIAEWSKRIGINKHCLERRKEMGWSIEEILTTPLNGRRNSVENNTM